MKNNISNVMLIGMLQGKATKARNEVKVGILGGEVSTEAGLALRLLKNFGDLGLPF